MVTEGTSLTNFDRIVAEIGRHAEEAAQPHGLAANDLVRLLLEIVNLEDENRVKPIHGVRQKMRGMIQALSRTQSSQGGG